MDFGRMPDGKSVELHELSNGRMTVRVTPYGAIITEIHVPDRNGAMTDVVLGFDNLAGYLAGHPYFGAAVGRVANRIAGGRFTLDGQDYTLARNNGPNTLHGGLIGFDKVVWTVTKTSPQGLSLTYRSPDGQEGFPGNLDVRVTYTLTDENALKITYDASTDRATTVNLTNHSYFNLAGPASGSIEGHEAMIAADRYTPVNESMIPTGEITPVQGTPLDFTRPTVIGARLDQVGGEPVSYDHNYVLREGRNPLEPVARVREPNSGRVLEVFTTEPGLQFYTGNFLDGTIRGKGNVVYRQRQGFCLEAQHFPDAVNQPTFPSIILRPGKHYTQETTYRFSVA